VVSSGKFVRAVILHLHEKIALVERGKRLKETWLVVEILPCKLLNGDVVVP
jgi:hypothetical protein